MFVYYTSQVVYYVNGYLITKDNSFRSEGTYEMLSEYVDYLVQSLDVYREYEIIAVVATRIEIKEGETKVTEVITRTY